VSRGERRQQILEAFALMLEAAPGSRITTAALARQVGVSEAALYRHFPSKARMIEGLIEFIETSIFSRISRILDEEATAHDRCRDLLWLLLSFVERNPGVARLLAGDALQGETDRLRVRIRQFYDRVETQLRQIIREGIARGEVDPERPVPAVANLMLAAVEGRVVQYVRTEFKSKPTQEWPNQWPLLAAAVFIPAARASAPVASA
jgi:TetR/AcrR family transcriptional regulator